VDRDGRLYCALSQGWRRFSQQKCVFFDKQKVGHWALDVFTHQSRVLHMTLYDQAIENLIDLELSMSLVE